MNIRPLLLLRAAMLFAFFLIAAAPSHAHLMRQKDAPFSNIPTEQRDALSKRLGGYVEAYKGRKWEKLYDFVSDMGKGGASQNVFVAAMKAAHGCAFAQMPDQTGRTRTKVASIFTDAEKPSAKA